MISESNGAAQNQPNTARLTATGAVLLWLPRKCFWRDMGQDSWSCPMFLPPCREEFYEGQLRVTAVSSMTNEVCSEESSVPVNLMLTDWPANADTSRLRWV
jgi:hypothetical protein